MITQDWINGLKKGFKGDISLDEKEIEEHSRDTSIFQIRPQLVLYPKTYKDIQYLVKYLQKPESHGITLSARAAGTDMTGGPLTHSVVVSFTRYINKKITLTKHKAVVQPGLYYRDLEKEMDKLGVMYPSYPASKSLCAWGGIVSNNSGGEKSLTYQQTVDHVHKVKVVLRDGNMYTFGPLNKKQLAQKLKKKSFEGEIYRKMYALITKNYAAIQKAQPKVSKNSSGYLLWKVYDKKTGIFNLAKLITGSQGTLGMLLEAEVGLVPKYKHSRLVAVYLNDLNKIAKVVNHTKKYEPESLESFDKATFYLGMKFLPEIAKKVNRNLLSFMLDFKREGLHIARHGIPEFIILVEFTGHTNKDVQERANKLGKELTEKNIPNIVMRSEKEGEKYWIMRRESFSLLRNKVKNKSTAPFIDDFAVKPEKLASFLPKMYKLLTDHGITPNLAGHAGDGNFHIIPLMDLKKQEEKEKIPLVLNKFVKLVNKYEGTITAEHNDGLIRTPFVEQQYGKKVMKLFEETKDIFDPQGIFNPGKKVRGNLQYAMDHIKAK